MTDIQKILNLLRNMRPSSKELIKIKILMACYDGWKSTHDIRRIANLGLGVQLRLVKLLIDDLIEVDSCKLIGNTGRYYRRNEYRITQAGIEYLTKMMR